MAFGDLLDDVTAASTGASTISSPALSGTPAATDLTVALHHTGDAVSNVDTAGFVEDQLITNATNGDEGAIYSALGKTAVTCSSGSSDEQMLNFVWIEGPFLSTVDVTGVGTVAAGSPCTSGTSGSSTAQGSEVFVAAMIIRDPTISEGSWAALGTATPSGAPTQLQNLSSGSYKSLVTAYKVLTGVGTVGATRSHEADGGNDLMGYATYKEDVGGGGGGGGPIYGSGILVDGPLMNGRLTA